MTPSDFRKAQSHLGHTNRQMAKAIGVSTRLVEEMRAGRRSITRRTEMLIEILLEKAD